MPISAARRRLSLRSLVLALTLLLAGSPAALAQPAPSVAGTWQDTLEVGPQRLRLVFHIEQQGDSLTATMDSPDQGATGVPVQRVRVTGDSLHLGLPQIGGRFDGVIGPDGEAIEGEWTQGGRSFPLALRRTEAATASAPPPRPQHPQPPYPYDTTTVRVRNEAAGLTLAGTLTLPEGEGPHPAVVLVSGSGPQDRNAEVAGHKLFHVVSDALTRRGIATLRYDERGVGASTGSFAGATTDDFAQDVQVLVEALAARKEIDTDRLGIYGHSEGGLVAPRVATRSDQVDFLVLLAPPGVPGRDLIVEQAVRITEAGGAQGPAVDSVRAVQERIVRAVTEAPDSAAAAERARRVLEAQGAAGAQVQQQVEQLTSAWYRAFLAYDPLPALRKVDVPTLVLFGEHDLQVPPDQNRPPIETALRAGARSDVTVRTVPGVNHLFQPAETGLPSEYRSIEATMAPEALTMIGDWIAEQTPPK
jgi:pimeloyl-ACP methyl ester carboxylesterase